MFNRLNNIKEKYEELKVKLSDPEVLNDFNQVKILSKEQSDLEEIVNTYNEYQKNEADIEEAKAMMDDPDLKDMASEELPLLEAIKFI